MNKYRQSFDEIIELLHDPYELDELRNMECFSNIKELVERATPMKVLHDKCKVILTECPNCAADIILHFKFCPNCGQALKSDNE